MEPHVLVPTDFKKGPESLSMETLGRCAEILRAHAVKPCTVSTPEEAKTLAELDILGGHWEVGDSYYVLEDLFTGVTPIKVFRSAKIMIDKHFTRE